MSKIIWGFFEQHKSPRIRINVDRTIKILDINVAEGGGGAVLTISFALASSLILFLARKEIMRSVLLVRFFSPARNWPMFYFLVIC